LWLAKLMKWKLEKEELAKRKLRTPQMITTDDEL
jgi:hypothetical protein